MLLKHTLLCSELHGSTPKRLAAIIGRISISNAHVAALSPTASPFHAPSFVYPFVYPFRFLGRQRVVKQKQKWWLEWAGDSASWNHVGAYRKRPGMPFLEAFRAK
jgi:hypothetical protein